MFYFIPLLLFFSITIVGKKHDFMDKLLTSFDEGKKDDQTTVLVQGSSHFAVLLGKKKPRYVKSALFGN